MRTILLLVAAVAFFGAAEALKCYQCRETEKNCADFDTKTVNSTTCPWQEAVCSKIVYIYSDKKTTVHRGCLSKTTFVAPKNVGRASDAWLTGATIYNCDTDLCNGVSATGAGLATLMVLSVPLIFTIWQ